MHRLFVALRPPAAIRTRLLGLASGGAARWQQDDQLHLTLRFAGELSRAQGDDLAAALGAIAHPPLSLRLAGGGWFDEGPRRGTLWAGVAPDPALDRLQRKVEQAAVRAGLAREGRAFKPHVTLARGARRGDPAVEQALAEAAALSSEPFPIEAFGLYESVLGKGGAAYFLAERYPLEGPHG